MRPTGDERHANQKSLLEGDVMIHPADAREWHDLAVIDTESHKIGVLEAVHVDTTTDEAGHGHRTDRAGHPALG